MWINYPAQIQESVDSLLAQERSLRQSAVADRVKMLRLLKSGRYRSQCQLACLLGQSDRTLRRWWQVYQQQGLAGLTAERGRGGRRALMTAEARQGLETAMQAGQIATLDQARCLLQQEFGIVYQGVSGLSRWCKRHRIKRKTGRRRHARACGSAQDAFKK